MNGTVPIVYRANLGKRFGATVVDYLVYFIVYFWYLYAFGEKSAIGKMEVHGLMAIPVLLWWWVWIPGSEGLVGRTLGHWLFDLEVRSIDGTSPSISQTIKRRLLDLFDFFFFFGIVSYLCVPRRKRNNDSATFGQERGLWI